MIVYNLKKIILVFIIIFNINNNVFIGVESSSNKNFLHNLRKTGRQEVSTLEDTIKLLENNISKIIIYKKIDSNHPEFKTFSENYNRLHKLIKELKNNDIFFYFCSCIESYRLKFTDKIPENYKEVYVRSYFNVLYQLYEKHSINNLENFNFYIKLDSVITKIFFEILQNNVFFIINIENIITNILKLEVLNTDDLDMILKDEFILNDIKKNEIILEKEKLEAEILLEEKIILKEEKVLKLKEEAVLKEMKTDIVKNILKNTILQKNVFRQAIEDILDYNTTKKKDISDILKKYISNNNIIEKIQQEIIQEKDLNKEKLTNIITNNYYLIIKTIFIDTFAQKIMNPIIIFHFNPFITNLFNEKFDLKAKPKDHDMFKNILGINDEKANKNIFNNFLWVGTLLYNTKMKNTSFKDIDIPSDEKKDYDFTDDDTKLKDANNNDRIILLDLYIDILDGIIIQDMKIENFDFNILVRFEKKLKKLEFNLIIFFNLFFKKNQDKIKQNNQNILNITQLIFNSIIIINFIKNQITSISELTNIFFSHTDTRKFETNYKKLKEIFLKNLINFSLINKKYIIKKLFLDIQTEKININDILLKNLENINNTNFSINKNFIINIFQRSVYNIQQSINRDHDMLHEITDNLNINHQLLNMLKTIRKQLDPHNDNQRSFNYFYKKSTNPHDSESCDTQNNTQGYSYKK